MRQHSNNLSYFFNPTLRLQIQPFVREPPPHPPSLTPVKEKMAKIPILIPLSLLILSLLLVPSDAEIKTLQITSDSRPMILFEKFGFTHSGHIVINVSSVSVTSNLSPPEPSRLGFFLLSDDALLQVLLEIQQNPNFCVLDSDYTQHLFTFRDLSPAPHSSHNYSYPIAAPNEYSLFFANCNPESFVTMTVHTEMYNFDPSGAKDYLPAGQTQLPTLYFLYSVAYFVFLGYWIFTCYKNKKSVHQIHFLMAGLLLMKALNLICAAEDKHYVKVSGTPHGWDVLFYLFQFIRVVLLFTVIVLVGTGWSFLKPFLQEKEKKVLMIVIPLQVLANVASIVIGETGPFIKDWMTWNQVFLLVDIVCCCAIIFPIVWSIRSLRETSKTDGKAARNLAKLTLFRQFYIVVIGYLYFTRIVVFALKTIAAYKYQWVSNAAEEIASLVFYSIMFYMFRPVEKNEYFVLDEEEEEAAELALRDEEFEL
ncbi:Protein CANDIDATE G-PROTEIN COUPLED REPTOR 7 [Ancistrocladus abbreviatus]